MNLPALRNVSFRYPGSESYALHNVSFKIEAGQLCVSSYLHKYVLHSMELLAAYTDHRWRERLREEHDLETDLTHIRPDRGDDLR